LYLPASALLEQQEEEMVIVDREKAQGRKRVSCAIEKFLSLI